MKTRGREVYLMGKCLKKSRKTFNILYIFRYWLLFIWIWQEMHLLFSYNAIVNEKEVFRDDEEN